MHNNRPVLALLFLFTQLVSYPVFADDTQDISINNVWISEAPPSVTTLAAYATIYNGSNETKTLASVSSPLFSSIEIHLSKVVEGIARMEKQSSLTINPKESIELAPGSYHLMLFNPDKPLQAGNSVSISFNFSDGTSLSVEAFVLKRQNDSHQHQHH